MIQAMWRGKQARALQAWEHKAMSAEAVSRPRRRLFRRLRCSVVDERRDLGAAGAPLGRPALGRGGRHGRAGLGLSIEQVLESFSSTATLAL